MKKIMVIDGDLHDLRLICDGLSKDFIVLSCSRVTTVFDLFTLFHPDALVLDPATEGLNAREFIARVRASLQPSILAVTRYTSTNSVKESLDWGADAIFLKSYTKENIGKKLREWLANPVYLRQLEPMGV